VHDARAMPGARIGDYVIDHEVSARHDSLVFLAHHAVLPRTACVIVGERTLLAEACALEAVRGPGVPRVYECGVLADRRIWIAIERIAGPTIADVGVLTAREAAGVLREIAAILERAVAAGVAHGHLDAPVIVRGADGWSITSWAGDGGQLRDDLHALGTIVQRALGGAQVPVRLATLLDHVKAARLSPTDVRHRATQLIEAGELDDVIVQVDVELVDISRSLG